MVGIRAMIQTVLCLAALCGGALATPVFQAIDITTPTGSSAVQSTPAAGVTPPGNGFPINAIDGNLGNFTHTSALDPNPSWTGTLGRDETFNTILVYNRGGGCCPERLSDITVSVLDSMDVPVFTSAVLNPANVLASPYILTVDLGSAVTGRKIVVARDGASLVGAQGILSIGEVRIGNMTDADLPLGTNLTQARIATMTVAQAPTVASPPGGGVASNGVDGNFGNFTHTSANVNVNHTWRVDFGEEMRLEKVALFNRSSCCGERLRNITVSVLDEGGTTVFTSEVLNPENVLGFIGTNQPGLSVDLVALNGGNPIVGKTVVVTRTPSATGPTPDDQSVLSLGEVEVTGGSAGMSAPFVITSFSTGPGEASVSLTWNSKPGKTYAIDRGTDLAGWAEVNDNVLSDGASTTEIISGPPSNLPAEYYRVRELP
jgi:hypothetical protein